MSAVLDHPLRRAERPDSFLIQIEAAELLRVSQRTLERWRLEGSGPPFRRFGRRVVYARQDLEDWATKRVFSSTSEADLIRPNTSSSF
jgi:excisionase family DNA binding protein